MFFMFIGTYTKWTFIDLSPVQRVLRLIFLCHTVTHGTDLRRSPHLRHFCILCTRPKSCFGGLNEQSGYLVYCIGEYLLYRGISIV